MATLNKHFALSPPETVKTPKKSQALLTSVVTNINVTETEILWTTKFMLMSNCQQLPDGLANYSTKYFQVLKSQDLFCWAKQNVALISALVLLYI